MLKSIRFRQRSRTPGLVLGLGILLVLAWLLLRGAALSLTALPEAPGERLRVVGGQLAFLEQALRQGGAARDMQRVFPEGASFILTLYGLAAANTAEQLPEGVGRETIISELRWAAAELDQPYVVKPFSDTQVRRGVFWLGQRNMLLARLLALTPEGRRPAELVREFHENSTALAAAFLASPTRHLDSYPGMCWPADNVTALTSLLIHDRLYGTDHSRAYHGWQAWTLAHADPPTGLPAGKLDQQTGALHEPARGCANSWIIGLLGREDPAFARELYRKYMIHFGICRLGFHMLREYPAGRAAEADVDSGPIVWGAGITATGAGLAAARAVGDFAMAGDIANLAAVFGYPRWRRVDGRMVRDYLFGQLPMGDAFLAWGMSLPAPAKAIAAERSVWRKLVDRWGYYGIVILLVVLMGLRAYFALRHYRKKRTPKGDGKSEPEVETRKMAVAASEGED